CVAFLLVCCFLLFVLDFYIFPFTLFFVRFLCALCVNSFSPWTNRTRFAILDSMKPALIVHGGAWDIPDEAVDSCKSGCQRALAAGWSILSKGGHALDAIEAAVVVLE